MAEEPDDRQKAAALAAALGKQSGDAQMMMMHPLLQQAAKAQFSQAGEGQKMLADAGQERARAVLQKALQSERLKAEAKQGMLDRASRERIGHTPPYQIIIGADGRQMYWDPRNPSQAAQPVMGPGGQPLEKYDPNAGKTDVPGMEKEPGATPTPEDAKKVKAASEYRTQMHALAGRLRELHGAHGTEYGGTVGNEMQALTSQIRTLGKNIEELGALSGGDMALIESIAQADPGGFWQNVKAKASLGLFDDTQGQIKTTEDWADSKARATQRAYGYRDKGAPQPPAGKPPVMVLGGKRHVLQPDGTYLPES